MYCMCIPFKLKPNSLESVLCSYHGSYCTYCASTVVKRAVLCLFQPMMAQPAMQPMMGQPMMSGAPHPSVFQGECHSISKSKVEKTFSGELLGFLDLYVIEQVKSLIFF